MRPKVEAVLLRPWSVSVEFDLGNMLEVEGGGDVQFRTDIILPDDDRDMIVYATLRDMIVYATLKEQLDER